jgi:predicted ArsR family transcriptional regulator
VSSRRPSARGSIVHLLKQRGELTAQGIADSLGITPVAVRKHLNDLGREGLVLTRRAPIPRGRPTIAYRLSDAEESSFPRGCGRIAEELLDELVALDGDAVIGRLIKARADRLSRLYQSRLADKDLPERIEELTRLRDEEGYRTVLEVKNGGLVLREQNCPIRVFAERYPEACACEQELLEQALRKDITCSGSVVDGRQTCEYTIDDSTPDGGPVETNGVGEG